MDELKFDMLSAIKSDMDVYDSDEAKRLRFLIKTANSFISRTLFEYNALIKKRDEYIADYDKLLGVDKEVPDGKSETKA